MPRPDLFSTSSGDAFLAGGDVVNVAVGARARLINRLLTRAGSILELHLVGLGSQQTVTSGPVEIVHNGATVYRAAVRVRFGSSQLGLPFVRIVALGQLELYFTNDGGGASSLTAHILGRYELVA